MSGHGKEERGAPPAPSSSTELADVAPDGASDHLARNRRIVVGASLLSGPIGLIPVPLAGDLAIAALRAFLVKVLAKRHGHALSSRGALVLAGEENPELGRLTATSLVVLLTFFWRRLTRAVLLLVRAEDMGRTFVVGTLFDHYCARHHPGGEIDLARARLLRRVIEETGPLARDNLAAAALGRVFGGLTRAGLALPRALYEMARALLSGADEKAERIVEEDASGVFSRASRLAGEELGNAGRATLSALLEAFDETMARVIPGGGTGAASPGAASGGEGGAP
jgi:hypothetical protein